MRVITANDLKTKGIKVVEEALLNHPDVEISVRGSNRYVVMTTEHYRYLRECELDVALAQSRADIEAGRAVNESVADHLARLDALNQSPR